MRSWESGVLNSVSKGSQGEQGTETSNHVSFLFSVFFLLHGGKYAVYMIIKEQFNSRMNWTVLQNKMKFVIFQLYSAAVNLSRLKQTLNWLKKKNNQWFNCNVSPIEKKSIWQILQTLLWIMLSFYTNSRHSIAASFTLLQTGD